jgi:probable rRNA maturation factor
VLEIEVIGIDGVARALRPDGVVGAEGDGALRPDGVVGPSATEVEELCALALSSAGIDEGHVAVEFVSADRIRELNREYRRIDDPTDVLSFGVDEDGAPNGPRELGDIVICLEHTADVREAIVHGALHLSGMDHETDDGEMLALQAELMRWVS